MNTGLKICINNFNSEMTNLKGIDSLGGYNRKNREKLSFSCVDFLPSIFLYSPQFR